MLNRCNTYTIVYNCMSITVVLHVIKLLKLSNYWFSERQSNHSSMQYVVCFIFCVKNIEVVIPQMNSNPETLCSVSKTFFLYTIWYIHKTHGMSLKSVRDQSLGTESVYAV